MVDAPLRPLFSGGRMRGGMQHFVFGVFFSTRFGMPFGVRALSAFADVLFLGRLRNKIFAGLSFFVFVRRTVHKLLFWAAWKFLVLGVVCSKRACTRCIYPGWQFSNFEHYTSRSSIFGEDAVWKTAHRMFCTIFQASSFSRFSSINRRITSEREMPKTLARALSHLRPGSVKVMDWRRRFMGLNMAPQLGGVNAH